MVLWETRVARVDSRHHGCTARALEQEGLQPCFWQNFTLGFAYSHDESEKYVVKYVN